MMWYTSQLKEKALRSTTQLRFKVWHVKAVIQSLPHTNAISKIDYTFYDSDKCRSQEGRHALISNVAIDTDLVMHRKTSKRGGGQ